jgi:cytochrome d ubiquinol oxidase subunit II
VLFGAALGNLLRGVPMGEDGWFTLPLFGSFSPWGELGVLDWYTVLAGVFALVAIAHHGALFLAWKTDGPVRDRATRQAAWLFPVTLGLWVIASGATWFVAPVVPEGLATRPLAWICTLLAIAGFATSGVARRAAQAPTAFLGSAAFLLGLLAATAVSVYPVMIYAANEPALSLTAVNAASSPHALRVGLLWWPAGALLAIGYFALLLYLHRGVVSVDDGDGY